MKQNGKSWWILDFFPLIMIWIYVLCTLFLFQFGLIRWAVSHTGLVILYVLLIYSSFSAGYALWLKKSETKSDCMLSLSGEKALSLFMLWIFRIGAIMGVIHSLAWINQIFGSDTLRFICTPGAAYDLSNFLGDLYGSGITPYPMWFRWISRLNTVLAGVEVAAVCIGTYQLKHLQIWDKILFSLMVAFSIFYAWLFGKQSLFMILVLQILISCLAKFISEIYREKSEIPLLQALKKRKKSLLVYSFSFIFLLLGVVVLIMFMQNDRVVQRNIRTGLYYEAVKKGGPPPAEQLQYFVLESVQKRTGYEIRNPILKDVINEKYGEYIKAEPPGSIPPGSSETPTSPQQPATPAPAPTLDSNFVGLSKFYKTIDCPILPGSIRYGLQTVEMYVTQGYASMALAFDLNFQWSRFVGNSIYISHLVDKLFNTNIAEETYTARNESVNGWSESVYFNTLYTWLASDLTFFGVVVLFFFFGSLLSKIWIEVINKGCLFAVPICYQLAYALIFAPTNNSLFNTLSEIIKTVMIFGIYVSGLLVFKRCEKEGISHPRRLTFVIGNLGVGGAAKMLTYAANISTETFQDVTILNLRGSSNIYPLNPKIKVTDLDLSFQKKGTLRDFYMRYKTLRSTLKEIAPDIIIAFVNPIIIYSYFAKPQKTVLIGADRGNPKALPIFNKILSHFVYPRCYKLVFQTRDALNCFKHLSGKSTVIENPFIPVGEDPGIYRGTRKKTIVSTSRLDTNKNVDVLIRAFAKSEAVKDYKLQIYGDGPAKRDLENLTSELGLTQKVEFMGTVQNILPEIFDAGMFVLVSKDEGMPNGLIEALALGIPCITTNCMAGEINPLVKHGENGLIVKIGDVKDLENAINLYCLNKERRQTMGLNGTKIRETLNENTIHQKWSGLFRDLREEEL